MALEIQHRNKKGSESPDLIRAIFEERRPNNFIWPTIITRYFAATERTIYF